MKTVEERFNIVFKGYETEDPYKGFVRFIPEDPDDKRSFIWDKNFGWVYVLDDNRNRYDSKYNRYHLLVKIINGDEIGWQSELLDVNLDDHLNNGVLCEGTIDCEDEMPFDMEKISYNPITIQLTAILYEPTDFDFDKAKKVVKGKCENYDYNFTRSAEECFVNNNKLKENCNSVYRVEGLGMNINVIVNCYKSVNNIFTDTVWPSEEKRNVENTFSIFGLLANEEAKEFLPFKDTGEDFDCWFLVPIVVRFTDENNQVYDMRIEKELCNINPDCVNERKSIYGICNDRIISKRYDTDDKFKIYCYNDIQKFVSYFEKNKPVTVQIGFGRAFCIDYKNNKEYPIDNYYEKITSLLRD